MDKVETRPIYLKLLNISVPTGGGRLTVLHKLCLQDIPGNDRKWVKIEVNGSPGGTLQGLTEHSIVLSTGTVVYLLGWWSA